MDFSHLFNMDFLRYFKMQHVPPLRQSFAGQVDRSRAEAARMDENRYLPNIIFSFETPSKSRIHELELLGQVLEKVVFVSNVEAIGSIS